MAESAYSAARRKHFGTTPEDEKLFAVRLKRAMRVRDAYIEEGICTICRKRMADAPSVHCPICQEAHH